MYGLLEAYEENLMKRLRLFLTLYLLAVLLAACAPATSTASPVQPSATSEPSVTPALDVTDGPASTVDLTATALLELLSATPPAQVQPVATSRGPELHATDPATVNLASGQLQLVEFFRFT
jgi:hypothetical protein